MNPTKANAPSLKPDSQPTERVQAGKDGSKKGLNINLKKTLAKFKKFRQKLTGHLSFIAILAVLLIYMLVVWQIRGLITAEPSPEDETAALSSTNIAKIDKKAIEQIQSLEQNNPEIRSLFNEARNNPFHE